jgi:hypothetical protein
MPHQKFARCRKTNDENEVMREAKSQTERGEKKPRHQVARAQADQALNETALKS